ncbi:MAG TPA: lipoyl(octanoyl) transferase LipB [Solirubrobacterales bacterium]|nr:lipoyl(octanoyl) transferase LipB [Solirubrobacterales bacterium]
MSAELLLLHCGTVPYRDAWDMQLRLAERRGAGEIPDVLMLLEHPPVYSRGRRTKPEELPMGAAWYEARGIEVLDTDRGGLVTYHGPGQLVAYPIVDLAPLGDDVHEYVRGLERVMIGSLAEHGVGAQTIKGLTGVWTDGPPPVPGLEDAARKIGSIGVHVSRGITTHGLAVNVDNDLQPFEWVVPCGIEGVAMTSIAREDGSEPSVAAYAETVARHFGEVFDRAPRAVCAAEVLGAEAAAGHETSLAEDREPAPATLGAER